jgi:hypothetical protein
VHVCGGDILVFRAFGVEAKVEINQPRIGWRVDIVVFPNNPKGIQVSVPAYPMGVYNYSIACTATGNVARGLSDPKIIIDK